MACESLESTSGIFIPSNFTKDSLNVTAKEREKIKTINRDQSQSAQWYIARSKRITGSTCGRILMQHTPTPASLSAVLYSKPFITLSPPIKWGLEHEIQANRAYLEYAKRHGNHKLATRKCGFIIHPTMGFLGASPDAHVQKELLSLNLARKMLLHGRLVRMKVFTAHIREAVFF